MKLGELIERLDTEWDNYVPSEGLARECGIHDYIDADLIDHGFKQRPITRWYCTDTWVGSNVIYYNDRPVAVSDQRGRKCDTTFEWMSIEDARMVRDVLQRLVDVEQKEMFDIVNPDQEVGEPAFTLNYSSEIMEKEALYKDEMVPVVNYYRGSYDRVKSHIVEIKYKGENIIVKLSELKFPVKLLPKAG